MTDSKWRGPYFRAPRGEDSSKSGVARAGVSDQYPEILPTSLLVIDDDAESLDLVVAFMADYGFCISLATRGFQGLAMADVIRPSLILLDIMMPDLDGFEVLAKLKAAEETRGIPVLLLTARQDTLAKVRGFELGAVDFVTKPVVEAELQARVTSHLRRQELVASLERRLQAYEDRQRRYERMPDDSPSGELPADVVDRIFRARLHLVSRLASPPTLDDLAEFAGLNQPALSRGFRVLFGTTVFGFLREQRLQLARKLLVETDLPIKAIAFEIGYRNPADLTRSVKQRFSLTPSELRNGS